MSVDFRGHGKTPGLPGYVDGPHQILDDGVAFAKYAQSLYDFDSDDRSNGKDGKNIKLFFVGSSMGGAIALAVAEQLSRRDDDRLTPAGIVMLAPMLRLSVGSMERVALQALYSIGLGSWQVIPSSSTNDEKQYRDPVRRKECEEDECVVAYRANSGGGSTIRVGSAYSCVEITNMVQQKFAEMDFPLLIMVGDEDVVVNNQGSLDLMEQATSQDKTLKRYPALHGLLCEPSPLVDTIQSDMLDWVVSRVQKP